MKINIPKDWGGVTIQQFQEIQDLINEGCEDKNLLNVAIISVLSGWPVEQVEALSVKSYKKILSVLTFISEPITGKVKKHFKLNGVKYRVVSDIYDLTSGQYISLMHFVKDEETILKNLHNIVALFCIPYEKKWYGWRRGKYNAQQHEATAQEMKRATMDIVNPLSAFFLAKYLKSVKTTLAYSVNQLQKAKTQAEKELARLNQNTVG